MYTNQLQRILHISSFDLSMPNGPGINEREFMNALKKRPGVESWFLMPRNRLACPDINPDRTRFYRNPSRWNLPGWFVQQVQLLCRAKRLIREKRIDFVVMRLTILSFGLYLLSKRIKVPFAVKSLDYMKGAAKRNKGLKGLLAKAVWPLDRHLISEILKGAKAVDSPTKELIELNSREFNIPLERFLLVENATNAVRFHPAESATTGSIQELKEIHPVIGYVGGRAWEKGGTHMIRALPRILSSYPDAGVVIVCSGGKLEGLRRLAQELGVVNHCVFYDRQPYERMPEFINAFDVGVAVNKTEHLKQSGNSSQKIRQYVACGKPVVAHRSGNGFIERERLGSLVDPDNLDEICQALVYWLGLSEEECKLHAERASAYAVVHLSTQKALGDRLRFWNSRIDPSPSGPGHC